MKKDGGYFRKRFLEVVCFTVEFEDVFWRILSEKTALGAGGYNEKIFACSVFFNVVTVW